LQEIKDHLDAGIPAILKVKNSKGTPHWVVVKGYGGDELIINDPASADPILGKFVTLSTYGYVPYGKSNVVYYQKGQGIEVQNIIFKVHRQYKLLISDADGRSTGYDLNAGEYVEEIPGSYNFFNQGYGESNSEDYGENVVVVPVEGAGEYKVGVFGDEYPEGVELRVDAYDSSGQRVNKYFQVEPEVKINYDPDSEDVVSLVEEPTEIPVEIDVRPFLKFNYINLYFKKSLIPVALLKSGEFDPFAVGLGSVRFGEAEADARFDRLKWMSQIDVDRDRDRDRVMYFETGDTGIVIGDTEACMTGVTSESVIFRGCDRIWTVPAH